jgi:hypothetical protein
MSLNDLGDLTPHAVRRLQTMFQQVDTTFRASCNSGNHPSFPYRHVLHKLLELEGHALLLHRVPLLKCIQKRVQQDGLWERICHENGWAFFPSILSSRL